MPYYLTINHTNLYIVADYVCCVRLMQALRCNFGGTPDPRSEEIFGPHMDSGSILGLPQRCRRALLPCQARGCRLRLHSALPTPPRLRTWLPSGRNLAPHWWALPKHRNLLREGHGNSYLRPLPLAHGHDFRLPAAARTCSSMGGV